MMNGMHLILRLQNYPKDDTTREMYRAVTQILDKKAKDPKQQINVANLKRFPASPGLLICSAGNIWLIAIVKG